MLHAIKEAIALCKTIFRNGYDAHVINAPLQFELSDANASQINIDIGCEPGAVILCKIFPDIIIAEPNESYIAKLVQGHITFYFYLLKLENARHPDNVLMKITPSMVKGMDYEERVSMRLTRFSNVEGIDVYKAFDQNKGEQIRLAGLPIETLHNNLILGIRAIRLAANLNLPIEPNTWVAIVRSSTTILDYISINDMMDEWYQVKAECMWRFVQLLYDAHILQTLIPEVTALDSIKQVKNDHGEEETVFDHTIACMKHYPEEEFCHDWLGTLAMLFHDVGKLYTAEYFNNSWTFYQHHNLGSKITRAILKRLNFLPEDIELISGLVKNHMRFHFMLTDRGIRRFRATDEYPRLIEMYRADIKARDGSYTSFNHNMKYLERAEKPEQMVEPFLNGNEIMSYTNLSPGPLVGELRNALLQAQIAGEVDNMEEAIAFIKSYVQKHAG